MKKLHKEAWEAAANMVSEKSKSIKQMKKAFGEGRNDYLRSHVMWELKIIH